MTEPHAPEPVGEGVERLDPRRLDAPVTRRQFRRFSRQTFAILFALFVVQLPIAALSYYLRGQNSDRINDIQRAADERRSQTCTVFEGDHLQDVLQLRQTYRYLRQLTPQERGATLNRFVIQGLPAQEKKAATDSAPAYCDQPGAAAERRGAKPIGLPEPDPVVPCRPDALRFAGLPPQPQSAHCRVEH